MSDSRSGREFVRDVGADLDKWTDAMAENAKLHGFIVEREWLRGWLQDAMRAAQKAMPKSFPTDFPLEDKPDGEHT